MLNYVKEHLTFIIIVAVLIGGFSMLLQGSTEQTSSQARTARSPEPSANMESPMSKGDKEATVSLIQSL